MHIVMNTNPHKHRKEQQLQNIHTHIQIDTHTHFEWGVEPSSRIKPKAGLKTPLPYQITTVAHNPQSSMSIICSPANLHGLCHFQGTFHSPDLPTIHIKHNKGIITRPPYSTTSQYQIRLVPLCTPATNL